MINDWHYHQSRAWERRVYWRNTWDRVRYWVWPVVCLAIVIANRYLPC
jgi:hypothetical protein